MIILQSKQLSSSGSFHFIGTLCLLPVLCPLPVLPATSLRICSTALAGCGIPRTLSRPYQINAHEVRDKNAGKDSFSTNENLSETSSAVYSPLITFL